MGYLYVLLREAAGMSVCKCRKPQVWRESETTIQPKELLVPLQTVLIVEDEQDIASMLAEALSFAQFDVKSAPNRKAAVDALQRQAFDIVLIDLRLPDGSGLDLAREIRATSETPIVMMSGQADDIDRIVGLEMVADDYLQKPFSNRELIARFRAILRRSEMATSDSKISSIQETPATLSFHGFTLTRAGRELIDSEGNQVELTTREFDVLWILADNQGKVLSRQEIYVSSGMGKGLADRQVDGLISRLRSKLYSEGDGPRRIRTVHGRGYILTTA